MVPQELAGARQPDLAALHRRARFRSPGGGVDQLLLAGDDPSLSPRTPLGYVLLPLAAYLRGSIEQRFVILSPLFPLALGIIFLPRRRAVALSPARLRRTRHRLGVGLPGTALSAADLRAAQPGDGGGAAPSGDASRPACSSCRAFTSRRWSRWRWSCSTSGPTARWP